MTSVIGLSSTPMTADTGEREGPWGILGKTSVYLVEERA
jgi:hypothetical protein